MGPDILYWGKRRKISKSHCDLDLVRQCIIYYNIFQFHVPGSIPFLSYHAKTRKHKNIHTDSDEYSIVAFCKNTTIIKAVN